jgi:hypothetical protein
MARLPLVVSFPDRLRVRLQGTLERKPGYIVTAPTDDMLLDELRRNATVSSRHIRNGFVEVYTPVRVLGYVTRQRKVFVALRGDDPAWAREIGRYPSESLAVEALRMRRG